MKTYKLLRDMPTVKAGTTFREITREVDSPHFVKKCAGKKGGRISKRK